jgi:hypothetical protein
MKRFLQLLSIAIVIISCNRNTDKVVGDIKIDLYEALSNPEAYELIKEIENEYVSSAFDASIKNVNILDKAKYNPLTSTLYEYNKMCNYRGDSCFSREGPCGFCAQGIFEENNVKLTDSILKSSDKLLGKFNLLWTPMAEELYFLSILTKNSLSIKKQDITDISVEDFSFQKMMSYPIHNYDETQIDKKIISVKWDDKVNHKIDSIFGKNKSFVCVVTINNHAYVAGELDSLNTGVRLRDINEDLLNSLDIYFPKK